MTFEKAFEAIKKKFVNADASKTDNFAVQITFADEDCGGTFYAEVKDGVLHVEPYDYHDNNAALTITKGALLGFLGKRMSLEKAISEVGAVYGDVDKIENLRKLVSVEKRPYNSKKAAAETKNVDSEKTSKTASKKTQTKRATRKNTKK